MDRDARTPGGQVPQPADVRIAILRFVLGALQMVGSVAGFMLLVLTGFTPYTIGLVVATGTLTLVSRVLFRGKQR